MILIANREPVDGTKISKNEMLIFCHTMEPDRSIGLTIPLSNLLSLSDDRPVKFMGWLYHYDKFVDNSGNIYYETEGHEVVYCKLNPSFKEIDNGRILVSVDWISYLDLEEHDIIQYPVEFIITKELYDQIIEKE